jgi:lysophospholipase L1-like esterase
MMGTNKKKKVFWITMPLMVALVTFSMGEIIVRLLPTHITRLPMQRTLLWSAPNFERDQLGALRFARKTLIREIAVYGDHIEYDITYGTNNFGLVDDRDYPMSRDSGSKGVRRYALVGDSLTAGSGCEPWVPQLARRINVRDKNVEIYNLGIPATGPEQFYRILRNLDEEIHFTDIVILAITGDFTRLAWRPLCRDGRLTLCPESEPDGLCVQNRGPVAKVINLNLSKAEIEVLIAAENRDSSASDDHFRRRLRSYVRDGLKRSKLLTLLVWRARELMGHGTTSPPIPVNIDLDPLRKIKNAFQDRNIHFIHLPEKDEVRKNRYRSELKDKIESLGIAYYPALYESKWSPALYFEYDGHPNCSGYKFIADLIERYLPSDTNHQAFSQAVNTESSSVKGHR